MRKILTCIVGSLFVLAATSTVFAQLGIERRVERRQERRADADAWRMHYYNNQWWYYTPQNQWMYYDNNNWSAYNPTTYLPPAQSYNYGAYNYEPGARGRYYAGYRGFWGPPANPNVPPAKVGVGAGVNAPANVQTGAAVDGANVNAGAAVGAQGNAPAADRQVQAPQAPALQQPQAAPQGGREQPSGNQQTPAPKK